MQLLRPSAALVVLLLMAASALDFGTSPAPAEAARHAHRLVLHRSEQRKATFRFAVAPWLRGARRVTAVCGSVRRPIDRARFLRAVGRGHLTLYPRRCLHPARQRHHWVVSMRTTARKPTKRPPRAPALPAPETQRPLLMAEDFEGANHPNNLITNEYAAWHGSDATAAQSTVWHADGGSLFSVPASDATGATSRVGYTGELDSNFADRYSLTNTHSNKMRFWTKRGGFGDIRIDADIKPTAWGAGAPSSWGGFKFYLRRQRDATESSFYTAEPFILDGHIYIQKKCLGDTGGGNYSTGGTYYLLAGKSGYTVPLGSWQKIGASATTNSDGSVTISLYRNGTLALQATDRGTRADGTGCAPLGAGHLGFRSDYLQYYLDNWNVTANP